MDEERTHRGAMLRAFLEHADEPCPACGYNLHGLTGGACPECGEALRLRVGMVEPRMGLFLAGLVGLACGVGFNGMILVWWLGEILRSYRPMGAAEGWTLLAGLATCGGGMAVWLAQRARVRRAPVPVRWALVGLCWLVSGSTAVAFFRLVS